MKPADYQRILAETSARLARDAQHTRVLAEKELEEKKRREALIAQQQAAATAAVAAPESKLEGASKSRLPLGEKQSRAVGARGAPVSLVSHLPPKRKLGLPQSA